jgi:DNA-binding response OmpR family regulator
MSSGDARSARKVVPRPAGLNPSTAPKKPERPTRRSEPPRSPLDPSVLVIGADEMFLPALRIALTRHKVHVETTTIDEAVETVVVAAPDLILLAGDAAKEAGNALLQRLTSSQVSSVIPVALLSDDVALDGRLKAFRHGAAAVIPRSASIDAVAEEIARLAREIPERGGDALGEVGEATLEEFVSALTRELRSGILSVKPGEQETPVRLVLGSGRPLAAFIDEFVTRVRRHVVRAEPLRYEFDERAGGTVQFFPGETRGSEPPPSNIKQLRLLLADDEPARERDIRV